MARNTKEANILRYILGFAAACVAVGFLFVASMRGGQGERIYLDPFGVIDWSVIGIFSLLALLSVWGMIGVALSKFKEEAEGLAAQNVVISKKSWHYRLNTWANLGREPSEVRSECEYWAMLFHGLYATPWIWAIIHIVWTIVAMVAWLFSARPNYLCIYRDDKDENWFNLGHQFVGPIVLVLMALGLIYAFVPSEFWTVIVPSVPWIVISKWSGAVVGGTAVAFVAVFIIVQTYRAMQPLFSAAGARLAGVCRGPVTFVD